MLCSRALAATESNVPDSAETKNCLRVLMFFPHAARVEDTHEDLAPREMSIRAPHVANGGAVLLKGEDYR